MAFIKTIQSAVNGHPDSYWRVTAVAIDAPQQVAAIVLSGYRDAAWRQGGGKPNQSREYTASGADFVALATAPAAGQTTFDVIAGACYDHIRSRRRPIHQGAVYDEDGGVTLPTGEHYTAAQIVDGTVPSELADAANG